MPNGFHLPAPAVTARVITRNKKSLEQVQLCLGVPSHPISDEKRYVSYVLNTVLGGGMSSRLFQNIREKQGLVYAIFSELAMYHDAGCMLVYAGTSIRSARKVINSIVHELNEVASTKVSEEELRRAKDHLKGSTVLGMESTSSRMGNLARQELYFKRFFSLDEMLERIERVTANEVQSLAQQFFDPQHMAVAMLGRLEGFRLRREDLTR
jgi:predicted Zn-dependent peptidase